MGNLRESLIEYSTPWGKIITKLNGEFLEYIQDKREKKILSLFAAEGIAACSACWAVFTQVLQAGISWRQNCTLGRAALQRSGEWNG